MYLHQINTDFRKAVVYVVLRHKMQVAPWFEWPSISLLSYMEEQH